jgi:hypothetical protein
MNMNASLDLKKIKLPKLSPTSLVLVVTIAVILGIAGWTSYSYFIAPATAEPNVVQPKQYYTDQLKSISSSLERYSTYDIKVGDSITVGTDDPFQP